MTPVALLKNCCSVVDSCSFPEELFVLQDNRRSKPVSQRAYVVNPDDGVGTESIEMGNVRRDLNEANETFVEADTNRNNKLSRDEFGNQFGNELLFEAYDENHDNSISKEEYDRERQKIESLNVDLRSFQGWEECLLANAAMLKVCRPACPG